MSNSDGEQKIARIGVRGDEESDKDYCVRMLKQHPTLSDAVFGRMLRLDEQECTALAEDCLAVTRGLANDDLETWARFAKAWRECLCDAGVSAC